MNRRTLIISIIVASLALAVVPFVYAQGHGRHGQDEGSMMLGRLEHAKQALGLSDEQVTQIKTIVTDLRTQDTPLRQQLHTGLQGVATALINNPADVAGAQALLDAQDATEHTVKTNTLNAAAKALGVLTAEQRTKLAQLVAQHHSRHNG